LEEDLDIVATTPVQAGAIPACKGQTVSGASVARWWKPREHAPGYAPMRGVLYTHSLLQ